MGVFYLDFEVALPVKGGVRTATIKHAIVDTGSELTWVPQETLRELGTEVWKENQRFVMANGDEISRDIGYARVQCGGFQTVDEIVFAKEGDLALLGARTLEGFNARVDPAGRKLVASGPLPAVGNRRIS